MQIMGNLFLLPFCTFQTFYCEHTLQGERVISTFLLEGGWKNFKCKIKIKNKQK